MTFTKRDCSPDQAAVCKLEHCFGFCVIEAVASLNLLSNTAFEELFAIRRCCTIMQLPGERHFEAVLHLLHHIRCHPPKALCWFKDFLKSPLAELLCSAKHDPKLFQEQHLLFADSAFSDCDDQRSTGCYLAFLQGGLVDFSSFVPTPITLSSAESESNTLAFATMAAKHLCYAFCNVKHGTPDHPLTVCIFTDSSSAVFILQNERDTKCTRHVERQWLFSRQAIRHGNIALLHIDGKLYQLADPLLRLLFRLRNPDNSHHARIERG